MKVTDEAEEKNQFKENILSAEKLNESWGLRKSGWREQEGPGAWRLGSSCKPTANKLCDPGQGASPL